MYINVLKSKIHRVTVTQADLDYIGSITIDENLMKAANINFIAFSAFLGDAVGQAMVIMTISVAAAEVAVGIAIVLNAYKTRKTTDADDLTTMRW